MEYKLTSLGVMLPDYFSGYHEPVLTIPVFKGMTKKELTDSIIQEYNSIYDYLESEKKWTAIDSEELAVMADDFILEDILFEYLDDQDSDDIFFEGPYLHICIEEE